MLFGTNWLDSWDASIPLQFSEFGVFQEAALRALPPPPVPPLELFFDDHDELRFCVHRWDRSSHLSLLNDPLFITQERQSTAFCREVGCMHYDLPVHEFLLCRPSAIELLRDRTMFSNTVCQTILSLDFWECLYLNDSELIPIDARRDHNAFFNKYGGDAERFWRARRCSHSVDISHQPPFTTTTTTTTASMTASRSDRNSIFFMLDRISERRNCLA